MQRNYWLDLFTYETWKEFLEAGATVSGFRENRWKTVQSMKRGDMLLCYLTGVSRWIGILEITDRPFKDTKPIWKVNDFPARVHVKLVAELDVVNAVPVIEMKDKLSIFQELKSPHAWTGRFRGSPSKWNAADGEAVVEAIRNAIAHPIQRPFDPAKLKKKPPILKASRGRLVTIPEDEESESSSAGTSAGSISPTVSATGDQVEQKDTTVHTEIQWQLLRLGNDMGLDIWVAKNDRYKVFAGTAFTSLPKLRQRLPLQFDEATTRTIELIDVLWLKGNSIQAAFEIESTTSIFSGLLRMPDLITMQPNLSIPLYIVAPSERRNKVIAEVNRPTFAQLNPPMAEMCRFISFEELGRHLGAAKNFVQFLKPEFLDSLSESCEINDI